MKRLLRRLAPRNDEMRKRILFFSAFFPPYRGGAEVFAEEVGKRLAKTYAVTVLTARLSAGLPKEEMINDMRIVRLGFGVRIDKWLYPLLAFFKSFSISHDIVYGVLESYAGIGVALYKLFWKFGKLLDFAPLRSKNIYKPAILNLQSGTLDDWRRGFGLNYVFAGWIHRSPDAIHAISQHLANRAKTFGVRQITVIPNGIDLAKFNIHIPKDPNKIICVGRLYNVKGQDILLEAMPLVLKEFPDAKLHLVGDGPEKKKLKGQSEKLKVGGSIIFRGNLPHEEIPKEIASAVVFVGPSRREGQGIAFVEAMAAGTPVIGTNVGGIPEVIENGVNGILVHPENPQEIAQAVIKILCDPALALYLAENGKKRAMQYDWNSVAVKADQIINAVFIKK